MTEKRLIILRGIPGSGKSTFAEFLATGLSNCSDNHVVGAFSADDYFNQLNLETGKMEYKFDFDKLSKAHYACKLSVEVFMQEPHDYGNRTCIVHNTSTTEKEMSPYLYLAEHYGYEVTSLVVENRHGNASVHNVPEEALVRMKERFSVKL